MSRKLLAIIVGVLVLAGGGAAAFLLTRSDTDTPESSAQTQQEAGDTPVFNAQSTQGLAWVAKMVTTTSEGTINAVIQYDGKGNAHYTSTSGGQEISMYLTKDGFISCQGGSCFKLPQGDQNINSDIYEYSQEDVEKFRSSATYLGKESCPAGTCDVWSVEDNDNSYTTKVFLGSDGRPSKLTSQGPQGNTEVTYEYRSVTVNVPKNVQQLPGAQQN